MDSSGWVILILIALAIAIAITAATSQRTREIVVVKRGGCCGCGVLAVIAIATAVLFIR